jgi:predicted ester cyclase
LDTAGNDPKFGVGSESFRLQWRKWREAFPDVNFVVEEIIAEGNTLVTRWHLPETHQGEHLRQTSTGNRVSVDGVSIDRIENGMVVSEFDAWTSFVFCEQIGLIGNIWSIYRELWSQFILIAT